MNLNAWNLKVFSMVSMSRRFSSGKALSVSFPFKVAKKIALAMWLCFILVFFMWWLNSPLVVHVFFCRPHSLFQALCQWRTEKASGWRADPARRWSRSLPARVFDRPHWPRAWNRLPSTKMRQIISRHKISYFVIRSFPHIRENITLLSFTESRFIPNVLQLDASGFVIFTVMFVKLP